MERQGREHRGDGDEESRRTEPGGVRAGTLSERRRAYRDRLKK
jgi:hypothetical protein